MPKLNVQQNNAGVVQALKNALAIGQINGTLACDGENNFSAGTPGGGGVDLGITGATVGQVPVVASVNGSGAPTSWTPTTPGGGGDTSLGITGATAGEYAKIKTVDANGAPTSWESGSGGGGGSAVDPATATPLMDGTAAVGTSTKYAREDHRHPVDTTRAPLASPALTGSPTAPTPTTGNNSTRIATTAFVQASLPNISLYAPLASPAFTGSPTAPTQSTSDNSTKVATTAFVKANLPDLSTYAPLASPALTGTPTAPTAAAGTSTTQIATTAFAGAAASAAVNTALNRTTAVNAADTNYTTLMARGISLHATETTPSVNGAIAFQYG